MKLDIPEGAHKRVELQQADAERAVELVKSWSIESKEDYDKASDFLRQIKGKQKDFGAERDALVKPLRNVINRITKMFSAPLNMLSDAEVHLKNELKVYKEESDKLHEKMLMDAQTPQEVALAVEVLADKPEGIIERASWTYRVVDAEKIPKDYWLLDDKRISREARQHKEELCIPGIEVIRDTIIVARAK